MPIQSEWFGGGGGSGPTTYTELSATDPDTDITGLEVEELSDGSTTTLHAHGASGLPTDDTNPIIRDPVDVTKLGRFDVGALATGTTRVVSYPDADVNLADVHAAAHTAASHSDQGATGAELEELTDASSSTLHNHTHANATAQGVNDHHNESHPADHADGGAQEVAVQDLASDAAVDGQLAKADGSGGVDFEDDDVGINFIIDGGGSVITTGVKGYLEMPFTGVIESVRMLADQSGSIVVDIWKDTYANFPPLDADSITASAVPTISTATKSEDSTLTGWTTAITKGDILGFNVDSITTCERVTISLSIRRT